MGSMMKGPAHLQAIARTTEWGSNYFGTKIEGKFAKYYKNSATGGWEVKTTDGMVYYFGTDTASRLSDAHGICKWCLDKVKDSNGNFMTVSYYKVPGLEQGQIYPKEIQYTAHTEPGQATLTATKKVTFNYEGRQDIIYDDTTGSTITTSQRLDEIVIQAENNQGTLQKVRRYDLTYAYTGNKSHCCPVNL